MTAGIAQLGRLGPGLVTGGLVLFASWTVAYEVALLTHLPAVPTLLIGLVLGVVVLVVLRRLAGHGSGHLVPLPGQRAALAVLALTLTATALGLLGYRSLAPAPTTARARASIGTRGGRGRSP